MRSSRTQRVIDAAVRGGLQLAEVEVWLEDVRMQAHHRAQSELISQVYASKGDMSREAREALTLGTRFDDAELKDFIYGQGDTE